MKFSTRARYGLRLMVELAREAQKNSNAPVDLGKIAKITGLSKNYLTQLATSLKNSGLLHGVPGKKGGFSLSLPAEKISLLQIIQSVIGPIHLTECVTRPEICLNAAFCESRMVWCIVNHQILEALEKYTLADLITPDWKMKIREQYNHIPYLNPDAFLAEKAGKGEAGCPADSAER